MVSSWNSVSTRTFVLMPSLMQVKTNEHTQAVLDIMPGHLREQSWWSSSRDLCTLLRKFGNSEATDPRDNIYALLRVSSNAYEGDILQSNYEIDPQQAVRNTMSFLLFGQILDYSVYILPNWSLRELLAALDQPAGKVLRWALETGNDPISIKLLAGKNVNVDVNARSTSEMAPLWYLAENGGHKMVIRTLLDRDDVDVNILNGKDTPLNISARGIGK